MNDDAEIVGSCPKCSKARTRLEEDMHSMCSGCFYDYDDDTTAEERASKYTHDKK